MMKKREDIQIVIITGMSGAGKTVAMQSFEDLGYFCVDNLPPALIPKFVDLINSSNGKTNKVALVMDLRGRRFFDDLFEVIDLIGHSADLNLTMQILYLDAKDTQLVQRYKETRRSHPLATEGLPLEGIKIERKMLEEVKGRSQQIIDTTDLSPLQLRERIIQTFSSTDKHPFSVNLLSFGFKYGIPIDADLVFDVRFLPNPHYVAHLKPLTGLNPDVATYVFKWSDTQKFNEKILDLLEFMLPQYKKEGKSQLVVAIGCTGGQHRSVALAEYFKKKLSNQYIAHISHRDIDKRKGH